MSSGRPEFAIGGGLGPVVGTWGCGQSCRDCVPAPGFGDEKAGEGGEAGVYALPRRLCHRWDFTGFTCFTTFSPGHLKNLSEASADHCGGGRVFPNCQFFSDSEKRRQRRCFVPPGSRTIMGQSPPFPPLFIPIKKKGTVGKKSVAFLYLLLIVSATQVHRH